MYENALFSFKIFPQKISLFCLLLFYPLFAFSSPLKEWKKLQVNKDNLVMSFKTNPSIYASISRSSGVPSEFFRNKLFSFEALMKEKQKMLTLIKVQDWQVLSHQWKSMKNQGELYIEGSYLNYNGKKHFFQEFHIYSSTEVLQALVSAPSLKELQSSNPKPFFQKIRKGLIKPPTQ